MINTIASSKITMPAKILNISSSNFRCMKYNSTKLALIQAINIAAPTLKEPKSSQVTVMVMAVRKSSSTRIIPYVR